MYIIVVDSSHTQIDGSGDINLKSLKLNDVFHVPGLLNNLISIRKLTKDNNGVVVFFYSHCTF